MSRHVGRRQLGRWRRFAVVIAVVGVALGTTAVAIKTTPIGDTFGRRAGDITASSASAFRKQADLGLRERQAVSRSGGRGGDSADAGRGAGGSSGDAGARDPGTDAETARSMLTRSAYEKEIARRSIVGRTQAANATRTRADATGRTSSREAAQIIAARKAAARRAALARAWTLPVRSYDLTARFGEGGSRWSSGQHTGLDFAASVGTPIRAAGSGTVVSAESSGAYGNRTKIRHRDGTETWYCHQSRFAETTGEVTTGDVIGYVGATGNVTGPHLHFEVRPDGGDPIDPYAWLEDLGLDP